MLSTDTNTNEQPAHTIQQVGNTQKNGTQNNEDDQENTQIKQESKLNDVNPDTAELATKKSVDISISGKIYTINCPVDEEADLHTATHHINKFIQEIREEAPLLTHENLLVLCCLNLFEQLQQTKKETLSNDALVSKANQLVEKMLADIQQT